MIERANFYLQPRRWNKRYYLTPELCTGIVGGAADFIYYDPGRRFAVSKAEGISFANAPRPDIPDVRAHGWYFDTMGARLTSGD